MVSQLQVIPQLVFVGRYWSRLGDLLFLESLAYGHGEGHPYFSHHFVQKSGPSDVDDGYCECPDFSCCANLGQASRYVQTILVYLSLGTNIVAVFIGLGILGLVGYGVLLAQPKDMNYIWAGRALWGASASGLEYLVSSSVGDLFFVHQRGFHLALWHFALAGGNSLGQVIASQIVQAQGYVWAVRYA